MLVLSVLQCRDGEQQAKKGERKLFLQQPVLHVLPCTTAWLLVLARLRRRKQSRPKHKTERTRRRMLLRLLVGECQE